MIYKIVRGNAKKIVIVGEQIFYSLSTFVFTIACARLMDVASFGYFSLFFAALTLVVGLQRTLLSEPLLILSGEIASERDKNAYVMASALLSLGFAIIAAVILALCAALTSMSGHVGYIALFAIFPFLQDFSRYVYLLRKQYILLFTTTLVVTTVQFGLIVGLPNIVHVTSALALCIWGVGSIVSCAVFAVSSRKWLVVGGPILDTVRPSLKLGAQFAAEYLIGIMTLQSVLVASTFVSGPAAAAALRGANALIGPVRIVLQAMPAMMLTQSTTLSRNRSRLIKTVIVMTILFSMFSLVWLLVLMNLPLSVGSLLLGKSWTVVKPVLPFIGLALLPNAAVSFTAMGLKILKRGDMLARSRLNLVPFSLALSVGGALYAGAYGGAVGSLAASLIAAFFWTKNFFMVAQNKDENSDLGGA